MASGLPKTDNAPLDPGGQAPGQGVPPGPPAGTSAGATPPAPPGASGTVPQSEGFTPSLDIDPRDQYHPRSDAMSPKAASKAPGKRLQDYSPDALKRAPAKALFASGYKDMEETLLGHLTGMSSAIFTELDAVKAYISG